LAGAIVKAGGRIIQKESDEYFKSNGKLKEGEIFVTSAGNLACKFVIHAVGPYWRQGKNNEKENLQKAVKSSILEASNRNLTSISLPGFSLNF
jgi:O-acetyl-ADP-ribose deacetylase (regulator of RNase III)